MGLICFHSILYVERNVIFFKYDCCFTFLKCENTELNLKEVTLGMGDKLALLLIVGNAGPLGTRRP